MRSRSKDKSIIPLRLNKGHCFRCIVFTNWGTHCPNISCVKALGRIGYGSWRWKRWENASKAPHLRLQGSETRVSPSNYDSERGTCNAAALNCVVDHILDRRSTRDADAERWRRGLHSVLAWTHNDARELQP